MTEPITTPPPDPTPTPEPTPALPPAPEAPPGNWGDVFKHPRFKELNDRAKAAEEALAKLEADQKTAADAALVKKEEYKTLYEQSQVDLQAEKLEGLRLKVGLQAQLPLELSSLLVGQTQEEMEAHAIKLQEFIKPATGPGQSPPAKGQPTKAMDLSTMTPEKIREMSKGKSISELVNAAA